jgi:hypothetical protein
MEKQKQKVEKNIANIAELFAEIQETVNEDIKVIAELLAEIQDVVNEDIKEKYKYYQIDRIKQRENARRFYEKHKERIKMRCREAYKGKKFIQELKNEIENSEEHKIFCNGDMLKNIKNEIENNKSDESD